ncbi:MAG: PQQ-like beta-propeller repeat protein, partial [Candidatus Nealsonbacteria bacterium]|nr:PQQ-like beta-propeller repeat protein [Candidatus Nealsonbacteria bacterium]
GTIKWKFWPKNSVFEGSVAIGKDGTIYFGVKGADDPRKANFYAITADGKEKWKFPLTQGLSITPALADDGTVYFGDWGGTFYALTSDGKEKWRVETPGGKETYESLSSSPAIGKDGTIYFGSIANAFFAYTSEGKEKWKISLDESGVVSAPAIGQDGTVYFAPTSGQLIAVGEGAGTETSVTTDNLTLYLSIAAFLLAAVFILIIVLHRRRPVIIIIFALLAVGLLTFGGLQIAKMVKSPPPNQASNEDNIEECPKNVYQKDAEKYYISGKQSEERIDLSDENLKWIKENCKETVWPGQRQESEQNKNQESDKAEKEINCPRRVYGAPDSGYYGIYGMNQRDLTTEEFKWARQNCPGTIWPEDMQKGYRGD